MKNLDEFLRLSHYLKSFKLYQSFSEVYERNKRAIAKIESNLEHKAGLSHSEEQELKQYRNILEKVYLNNKVLENNFDNYDFSDETIQKAMSDYKIYVFEFIVDTILGSLQDRKLNHKKDVLNHIQAAEKVIRKHFIEKFYIPTGYDAIFEKASESILSRSFNFKPIQSKKGDILKFIKK
jgi:hypothetical protein